MEYLSVEQIDGKSNCYDVVIFFANLVGKDGSIRDMEIPAIAPFVVKMLANHLSVNDNVPNSRSNNKRNSDRQ